MRRLAEIVAERSLMSRTGAVRVARIYVRAGEEELVLDWLERAFAYRDPNLPYLLQPAFDGLRDKPRFQDLVKRMNLPR